MPKKRAQELISSLKNLSGKEILIIGDVMLDRYLYGEVDRISPEAPVPVVNITEERVLLGGAGNVAKNIQQLGGKPILLCVSGDDAEAELLSEIMRKEHIDARIIKNPQKPTIIKTRVIAHSQQVVRIDKESAKANDPEMTKNILESLKQLLPKVKVVILSDYHKGIMTEQLVEGLNELVQAMDQPPIVLVDPKPVNFKLFSESYLLTPNAKEAAMGADMETLDEQLDILNAGAAIQRNLSCKNLLITLGSKGMVLFEESQEVWHIPTMAQRVFDVTGAGDTVIATVGLALAAGNSLLHASLLANYAAGMVVGRVGTSSVTQEEIIKTIERLPFPDITQWN